MKDTGERSGTVPDMVLRGIDHREVERVHTGMADFLCWAAGHSAALQDEEIGRRGILGVHDVRRAREILQRLVIVNGPMTQAKARPQIPLDWAADPESWVHMLRPTPALSVDDLVYLWNTGCVPMGSDLKPPPAPAGWAEPGWVSGPRAMWETARECADRMAVVGNKDPRGPIPVFTIPQGPVMPAAGIVGWILQGRTSGDRRLFCKREKAVTWHRDAPDQWHHPVPVYADPALPGEPVGWVSNPDGPGFIMRATAAEVNDQVGGDTDWCTPYPVYAQPRPALEPDWPREISDSMAWAYGQTLARQGGASYPEAAKALLVEFMQSHRPGPIGIPKGFVLMPAEMTAEQGKAVEREADKLVGNETADDRNRRSYRALVAARPKVEPSSDGPVDADFAEVPIGFGVLYQGELVEDLLRKTEAGARGQAPLNRDRVIPLYRSPEPPHLPEPDAWLVVDAKGYRSVFHAKDKTFALARANACETEARPLYALD